jgi:membrane carboxypeptidase/penicillin-binding protein PbpC
MKIKPAALFCVLAVIAALGWILQDQRIYRSRCSLSDVSPNAIAATLSAEDKRFRAHSGIDGLAIARALVQAVRILKR